MTELDKKIIEIIEPFMDKTLCEGCVVYIPYNGGNYYIQRAIGYYEEFDYGLSNGHTLIQLNRSIDWIILGHYDITAVEKYIIYKNSVILSTALNKIVFKGELKLTSSLDIVFPNKPLHLYTEEEKVALLDLLIKLK